MILRAGTHRFVFPRPAVVMGILNVTPDSFSDGGRFLDVEAAVDRARAMEAEGAEIIDVGGESTRPDASPVSEAEELRRVLPVLERLSGSLKSCISVDTMKPGVARAALAAGASLVNDVAANRDDPLLWEVVAAANAGYVAMHMQGTPQTMQRRPRYRDVVDEVARFFRDRLRRLKAAGVSREQVVLDVGIGFGKTVEHNLQLLAALKRFTTLHRPLLLGVSRKSFIGRLLGADLAGRLPAGLACAVLAREAGVQIIRTHDVAATTQALRMAEAIGARRR
jgi:dihydropteroate synthase